MGFSTPTRLPTAPDADRATYELWRRFKFPTEHRIRDAIAVSDKTGHQLVSAYTFLLNITFIHIWVAIVLLGVYLTVRKSQNEHTAHASSVVWINHSSPGDVLIKTVTHVWKKRRCFCVPLIWIFVALLAVIISYAIPIVLVPNLVIGSGAPVRPSAIYIPSLNNRSKSYQLEIANLDVPSALRAAGNIPVVNDTSPGLVTITEPTVIGTWDDGSDIIQFDYHYNITAPGFGLQHWHDLTLWVNGSCFTEYNWLISRDEVNGTMIDTYDLWNLSSRRYPVSLYDSASPHVYFFPGENTFLPDGLNTTYAAVISSVGRKSYTEGTDPWYLTNPNPIPDGTTDSGNVFEIASGRPVLSCWQVDSWTSGGNAVSGYNISLLPGLSNFPKQLQSVFIRYLVPPKIVSTATYLGAGALLSGSSALGEYFSANTSSLHADFSRLIFASYIGSVNTLTDTTLYSQKFPDIVQLISPENISKVAEFVLYSSKVSTLAVLDIIVIPVVALGLWVLVLALVAWEKPRGHIRALEKYDESGEKAFRSNRKTDPGDDSSPASPLSPTRDEEGSLGLLEQRPSSPAEELIGSLLDGS